MSHYTDEDVERAACVYYESLGWNWAEVVPSDKAHICAEFKDVLDAVAPAIAARALRETATDLDRQAHGDADGCVYYHTASSLRKAADEIERRRT